MSTPTEGNLALEPEWRREVSSRLQDYRVRRHGVAPAELQTMLPFEQASLSAMESTDVATQPAAPTPRTKAVRKQRTERYEISIPIHENPAASVPMDRPARVRPGVSPADGMLFPVASLAERRRAALLDAALLLFSYGGMLALFTVLGGHIGWNKLDAIVTGATLVLFYAQYFSLFTIFGGATPGMMVRGLRVISFDGGAPSSRQMAWRSLGYLISAGTCFLGFLWALWDEDRLTWQDRISQTYLTPAERFASAAPPSE
ncbi:MAG: RDD family protein [Acidobacteriia bacterium]|nr:RDD family protein [Terriglobia bacterium]